MGFFALTCGQPNDKTLLDSRDIVSNSASSKTFLQFAKVDEEKCCNLRVRFSQEKKLPVFVKQVVNTL